MGYFDGLTNGAFKKDPDGKTLFFPWGILGRGRVLPDEISEIKVRAFMIRYYKISLPAIVATVAIIGWAWAMLLVPILGAWFYFDSKSLVSDYSYSAEKLTLKEGYANSAASHNKVTLWLLFICSMLFVLAGIFITGVAKSHTQIALGLFATLFFGACGAAICYMLKVKK